MFLSIIIPTLNEEDRIESLLSFFENHPKRDRFEVIVVDGQSIDRTQSIVQARKCTSFTVNTCSRAIQMNAGAAKALGDVLYFVHADVQLLQSFVDDIEQKIKEGVESGCYRYKFSNFRNPLLHINGFFTRFPYHWCRGGDQTLFIKKSVFDQLSGFNEQYVIMEDYEFLDRMKSANVSFKVIPKSIRVSARKYEKNSYLKVQLANLKAMRMYRNGIEPQGIKDFYQQALD